MNCKETPSILTDPNLFKEKMDLLHSNIDMAIRFRTFYDKLMGVLVLLFCPERYKKFGSSGSRKADFKKLMQDQIDPESLDSLFAIISSLDDNFRTAEVHQQDGCESGFLVEEIASWIMSWILVAISTTSWLLQIGLTS